jgi:hypothetical protein
MSTENDDPTIKKITLTGAATEGLEGGRKSRKNRGPSRKIQKMEQEAGGATSPGTLVQLAATHVPGSSSAHAIGIGSNLTASGALIGRTSPSIAMGGADSKGSDSKPSDSKPSDSKPSDSKPQQRVVLNKTKKKGLLLGAPKTTAVPAKRRKTRTIKKIHVSVGGLTRKLHKAKGIRANADKQSFADIKKELVAAGLIKTDSKAPEAILRQMYSDFMVLKKRAL